MLMSVNDPKRPSVIDGIGDLFPSQSGRLLIAKHLQLLIEKNDRLLTFAKTGNWSGNKSLYIAKSAIRITQVFLHWWTLYRYIM